MESYANAVLIPDAPNWANKPRWSRRWQTAITTGVTGAEDRAALRKEPLESLEYSLLTELGEREALTARLQAALKSGRACIPRWDLPQTLKLDADARRAETTQRHHSWHIGDYAIFLRPTGGTVGLYHAVNCGGRAIIQWREDWQGAGQRVATLDAIDTGLAATSAAPVSVYQSKREVVGINQPGRLQYVVTGRAPGTACEVYLHFAEIYSSIETASAQMVDITVKGTTTEALENYQPYAVTGDFNRACVLFFNLLPDAEGRIEISLVAKAGNQPDPEGPVYWPCSLNGFEVIQHGVTLDQPAYEVRQLAKHSVRGTLRWDMPLAGFYPAGSLVYPLLFGKPTVADMAALTDHLAEVRLKVEEPLGAGDVATPGTCPVEVKPPSNPIWNDGYEPAWAGASCPAEARQELTSKYKWGFDGNLNITLTAAQIAWHIAMFENEKAKIPGVSWGPTFWRYTAVGSTDLTAAGKYLTGITNPDDPTGDSEILFAYNTTLAAQYCPGGGGDPAPTGPLTPSYGYCQV